MSGVASPLSLDRSAVSAPGPGIAGTSPADHSSPEDQLGLPRTLYDLADWSTAFAVRAASALGVADQIAAESVSIEDLAERCGVKMEPLRRLLNILVRAGALVETPPQHFALTPATDLLRQDHPFSMRDAYLLSPVQIQTWAALDYSLLTGRSAFQHVFGEDHRAYRQTHSEEDVRMDRAHRAATRIEVQAIMRLVNWSRVQLVVDIGGGTGAFVAGLLRAFKGMRAVVLELPRMAADAREFVENSGLQERCQVVAGSFFESVPEGADVYILKSVIGGWEDGAATRILRKVRSAMRDDSRLLVIEPILREDERFTFGNMIHLESLLLYGGPERRLCEYERIFSDARLRLANVVQRATLPVMELVPA
jgi:precorrin-6B methylase 2